MPCEDLGREIYSSHCAFFIKICLTSSACRTGASRTMCNAGILSSLTQADSRKRMAHVLGQNANNWISGSAVSETIPTFRAEVSPVRGAEGRGLPLVAAAQSLCGLVLATLHGALLGTHLSEEWRNPPKKQMSECERRWLTQLRPC